MKISLLLAAFLAFLTVQGQNVKSGIGTEDPQQTLHVAFPKDPGNPTGPTVPPSTSVTVGTGTGVQLVTPTVRIDGLNSTNNTANQPADPNAVRRVYATQDGDLVLASSNLEQQIIAQDITGDPIPVQEIVSLAGVGGFERVELKSVKFTLKHPSVVYFSASFAALIRETNIITGPVSITDGEAKLYGAYFQFSAAPTGVSTTATFGKNRKTYVNNPTSGIGVSGDFILNPRAKLILPAGSYTVKLYGELFTRLLGLLGRAQFGGTTNAAGENFLINATSIQYQ